MNKAELVIAIAEHTEIDRKTVAKVLDGMLVVLPMAVAAGDQVTLVGFGTFEATHRAARTGRHPQTREPLEIAASWTPKFSAGSGFKGLVSASEALKKRKLPTPA